MEEIEYKLKKKNAVLVVNAITKLVDSLRQKNDPSSIIGDPEYKLLKQKCEDAVPLVSLTACQGIVSLVEFRLLPLSTALLGLIAALTSARNYACIVPAIGNLLVIDMEGQLLIQKSYQCPFSIQSPQHPLITILKQKKDIWFDIFNQIEFLCNHDKKIVAENSLELLRPLLLYILCAPSQLSAGCRRQTWKLLLRQPHSSDFLMEVLSWLQIESEVEVETSASLYMELAEVAIENKDVALAAAMAPTLASLAHHLMGLGHDPHSCFALLKKLLQVSQEASSCVLMMMSETVASCPAIYLKDLLLICKSLVEQKACNVIAVKMLECAVLQWLVYPSYFTADAVQVANDVLNVINEMQTWGCRAGRLFANQQFGLLRPFDSRVDFAAHFCKLAEAWQNNPSSIQRWLERVSLAPEMLSGKLQLFLFALFLHAFDQPEVRQTVFKLLLQMVEQCNEQSGAMLALILYKLADEREPKVQLELLRGLTKMAVQKENITLILHTLETLKTRSSLRSLVIDLYVRLWKVENRCYPYLEKMLQEAVKEDDDSWELDIAKASALHEICKTRPDLYSAELVFMLSKILTRCGNTQGSLASSLALQGITVLCKAGIVDITVTWKALAPRLNKDKRPAVIKSWCEFFGAVPSIRCPTQEYEKLVSEAIMRLWYYVANSNNLDIMDAALNSLSKFNLDQLSLKTLPESYRQGLRLPKSFAKTPVDAARKPEDVLPYIPCECWIQMLQNIKPEALDAAGKMLSHWLNVELFSGRAVPTSCTASRISQGIVHYLLKPLNPEEKHVVKECLKILCNGISKPFPSLDLSFLEQFINDPELQEYCVSLLAKQASKSASAQKVIEDFIGTVEPSAHSKEETLILFSNLADLCNSVPPNILKPFIEKSLHTALEVALGGENGHCVENEFLLKELLQNIKLSLQKEDIHDANRTLLSIIAEGLLEKLHVEMPFFSLYVDCVVELPTKYLERMSSPSVWWEVTPEKLRLAVQIRSALAQRGDTGVPLVWLNEIIDATASLSGEHTSVLKSIVPVMSACRGHSSNCSWTLELMGQIQFVINKSESDKEQVVVFLCDVFIITVIVMSGHECLSPNAETIALSRETRLQLFPQSLVSLLAHEQWQPITSQMVEWLFHMNKSGAVSPLYANVFYQGLVSLRHSQCFKDPSAWLRFINIRARRTE